MTVVGRKGWDVSPLWHTMWILRSVRVISFAATAAAAAPGWTVGCCSTGLLLCRFFFLLSLFLLMILQKWRLNFNLLAHYGLGLRSEWQTRVVVATDKVNECARAGSEWGPYGSVKNETKYSGRRLTQVGRKKRKRWLVVWEGNNSVETLNWHFTRVKASKRGGNGWDLLSLFRKSLIFSTESSHLYSHTYTYTQYHHSHHKACLYDYVWRTYSKSARVIHTRSCLD